MNNEQMNEAFDAIHDVALKLLGHETPQEVREGLELIVSLSRYQFDMRSQAEKDKYSDQSPE